MKTKDICFMCLYCIFFCIVILLVYIGMFDYWNKEFPYIAGFFQFMIFATVGELLSTRILEGVWQINKYILYKAMVWGTSGLAVTLGFKVITTGIFNAMEDCFLPFYENNLAKAFFTSCFLNLFFAPIHAGAIRIFSSYGEEKYIKGRKMTAIESVNSIEWSEFVDFTFFKTVPFFWIPINTLVFLLPNTLQVAFAAMLSFVFGMLMTLLKIREKRKIERKSL